MGRIIASDSGNLDLFIEYDKRQKRIVCYSGGHSSAIVAIEVCRRYGSENVVLLNHDIAENVEDLDIKRFKREVADYLGKEIVFANIQDLEGDALPDQFDVCIKAGAFKVGSGSELCTSRLKTEPFYKWLSENTDPANTVIYYGFDPKEIRRIQRRSGILGSMGYRTDYPLALWKDRTIFNTGEIGIDPPLAYGKYKHANCKGCLKAGRLHWFITYCDRPDLFEKAKRAEDEIGYTILNGQSMESLEPTFRKLQEAGVEGNEHIGGVSFWSQVKRSGVLLEPDSEDLKPCECVF